MTHTSPLCVRSKLPILPIMRMSHARQPGRLLSVRCCCCHFSTWLNICTPDVRRCLVLAQQRSKQAQLESAAGAEGCRLHAGAGAASGAACCLLNSTRKSCSSRDMRRQGTCPRETEKFDTNNNLECNVASTQQWQLHKCSHDERHRIARLRISCSCATSSFLPAGMPLRSSTTASSSMPAVESH